MNTSSYSAGSFDESLNPLKCAMISGGLLKVFLKNLDEQTK